jgi:hypothetical protein
LFACVAAARLVVAMLTVASTYAVTARLVVVMLTVTSTYVVAARLAVVIRLVVELKFASSSSSVLLLISSSVLVTVSYSLMYSFARFVSTVILACTSNS